MNSLRIQRDISDLWLHPKDAVRMHEVNAAHFRQELVALIMKADREWSQERWAGTSDIIAPEPSTYPTLARVLRSIQCFQRKEHDTPFAGIPWIIFPNWGGAYHPQSMVEALQLRLSEKRDKYRSNDRVKSCDEFILVVHYDQALLYNTPVQGLKFGFKEAVAEARAFLDADPGAFTKIFVMIATEPGGRVFQLYP